MCIWTAGELEAMSMRERLWCVRPKGQLGTCGFSPRAWDARYVKANNSEQAIERALREINHA